MAAKVSQNEGKLPVTDLAPDTFDCVWTDPESRNLLEQTTALSTQVTTLGLSKHTALTELGWDADEEAEIKDDETQKAVMNFNAGLPTNPMMPNAASGNPFGNKNDNGNSAPNAPASAGTTSD